VAWDELSCKRAAWLQIRKLSPNSAVTAPLASHKRQRDVKESIEGWQRTAEVARGAVAS